MAKPFIPFPDGVVQISIDGQADGIPIAVVTGARFNTGVATASDGTALAEAIMNFFATEVAARVPTTTVYQGVYVRDLTTQFGWDAQVAATAAGTLSAVAAPNNVALCVTHASAVVGRSFRGRTYWAGLSREQLANQVSWLPSAQGQWQGVSTDLGAAFTTAGWTQVILSRQVNSVRRTAGVATPITAYIARSRIASLRKRLR